MKRRKIVVKVMELDDRYRTGKLDDVIAALIALKNQYPEHTDLQIEADGCYDGPDNFHLWGKRPETDREREGRQMIEEAEAKEELRRQKIQEAEERAEFERLKKKFGQL